MNNNVEIGGGDNPRDPDAVQMDYYFPAAHVKHDANKVPYPFDDNEFDNLYASHVLEHLDIHLSDNFRDIMKEWARIVKSGGKIHIWTPYAASITGTWANPEHRRPFVYHSFDWGDPGKLGAGSPLSNKEWYRHERLWNIKKVEIRFGKAHRLMGLQKFTNRFPDFYEHLLYGIFPAREIKYELRVL